MSTLRFLQLSDTHLGSAGEPDEHGRNPHAALERLIERVRPCATALDFVAHCGDIGASTALASLSDTAALLQTLGKPLLFVRGNYDSATLLHTPVYGVDATPLTGVDAADSSRILTLRQHRIVLLDADLDSSGITATVGAARLKPLTDELQRCTLPLLLFLHYPPVALDCPSSEAIVLRDAQVLQNTLAPFRSNVRGVFFGHAHASVQIVRNGITYVGAPSVSTAFRCDPEQVNFNEDLLTPPGCNLVTVTPDEVIVKQLWVPLD